jgi:hypothetical protein
MFQRVLIRQRARTIVRPRSPFRRALRFSVLTGLVAVAFASVVSPAPLQEKTTAPQASTEQNNNSNDNPSGNLNAQPGNQSAKQAPKLSPEDAIDARKRQIAEDSATLLKLADDLKAEVDKTNKDVLSLEVIRKADQIEKLAHDVQSRH